VLAIKFKPGTKRADKSNAIDNYVGGTVGRDLGEAEFAALLEEVPPPLTPEQRAQWLAKMTDVAVSSDAFFPFEDNVHRARQSGAGYIVAPAGSVNDPGVVAAADQHGIVMIHTATRLFHH